MTLKFRSSSFCFLNAGIAKVSHHRTLFLLHARQSLWQVSSVPIPPETTSQGFMFFTQTSTCSPMCKPLSLRCGSLSWETEDTPCLALECPFKGLAFALQVWTFWCSWAGMTNTVTNTWLRATAKFLPNGKRKTKKRRTSWIQACVQSCYQISI